MSETTPNYPRRSIGHYMRLRKIKENFSQGRTNHTEIALLCGVCEKTIDTDIAKWKESGEFQLWLMEEHFRLHADVKKEDLGLVYRVNALLLRRTMTQKTEMQGGLTLEIKGYGLGDKDSKPRSGSGLPPTGGEAGSVPQ